MGVNKVVLKSGKVLVDLTSDTVTADKLASGYTAHAATGKVITGIMASGAAPSISIASATGLVTATAGAFSSTLQLTSQAAQTITPGTANKTIASNRWLTGVQTIAGSANLKAANILSGVTLFGVTGTLSGMMEGSLIARTISGVYSSSTPTYVGKAAFAFCTSLTSASFANATTISDYAFWGCTSLASYSFPKVTTISSFAFSGCTKLSTASMSQVTLVGGSAFQGCTSLTTASFAEATTISNNAFSGCTKLTTVSLPKATIISNYAFYGCSSLITVNLPAATYISQHAFRNCYSLSTVSLPMVSVISTSAFYSCSRLASLYLLSTSYVTLANASVFMYTPMSVSTTLGQFGSIFVPSSMYDTYKTMTNWVKYSSRFASV